MRPSAAAWHRGGPLGCRGWIPFRGLLRQDWYDAGDPVGAAEVESCRQAPCYDCDVCSMGAEIQTGLIGAELLLLRTGQLVVDGPV